MSLLEFISNNNFDLVFVGVAVAAISVLGISVYFADRNSITNKTLFLFAISIVAYATCNSLIARVSDEQTTLYLLRGTLFCATWASLFLYQFFFVFPERTVTFPKWYYFALIPWTGFVSILTLTPFVFVRIQELSAGGKAALGEPGLALPAFGLTSTALVVAAIALLIWKWARSEVEVIRRQLLIILIGSAITFAGILVFNVALPLIAEDTHYIILAPVWFFPFIAFTSYSILRYDIFDVKTATTSLLTFALATTIIVQLIFADGLTSILFSVSQFILVLLFSGWLIQATYQEVRQRERIEKLAKELEAANERLKELDRQKTEFVSIASHQLRAPLTAIKGYASLILERSYGDFPMALKDPMEKIAESSRLMVNSIEDFLNISRIELGRMQYDMSEFDLVDLTKKVVSELSPVAIKKSLVMSFIQPNFACKIHADIGKIKQVITNFVDNAIKYTEKGTVDVSLVCDHEKGVARIAIKDTGIGMTKETITALFEKFTRARGANKVNVTGTGLGLYVAKQLVEGHKGRVWVESEGEGKGSTFFIELPLKPL